MNCHEALDVLLEADLADPRFVWNPDLSEHLMACGRCRSAADAFAGAESMLRQELSRAVERGVAPATTRFIVSETAAPGVRGGRGVRVAAALAAAAAVATLLLFGDLTLDRDPPAPLLTMDAVSMIEVPEGQSAMIFRTPDPRITVVWIYQDREQ